MKKKNEKREKRKEERDKKRMCKQPEPQFITAMCAQAKSLLI